MVAQHILRIPLSDSDGDFVLVNVTPNSSSPLDLNLLATEGESPYITTIRQSRLSKLRDKKNQQQDSEWETVLLSTLLQRRNLPPTAATNAVENLEVIATISGSRLAIIFRKNISGITQRLGEILLKQDDDQEIDTVSWTSTAVQRANSLEQEVQSLTLKYDEQSQTIHKMNQQLEELIEAKKAHEVALLGKFTELLNNKKMKIRDQKRLLAGARVDSKAAAEVKSARQGTKDRIPASSRQGKRKAQAASSSEEEDGFEQVVPVQKEEEVLLDRMDTPERSDGDVTEDESDGIVGEGTILPDRSKDVEAEKNGEGDEMQVDELPPKRELPFGKIDDVSGKDGGKIGGTQSGLLDTEAGNEDEETDDDEL